MKYFKVTLCSYKIDNIGLNLWAEMRNDILTINLEDLDGGVAALWGDKAYKYTITINEKNTQRLLELIGGKMEPISALIKHFGGIDGSKEVLKICKANNIKYNISSE